MRTPIHPLARALVNERLVVVAIILNTAAIFLRSFPSLAAGAERSLFAVDYACSLYFLLELAIRAHIIGARRFLASWWNRFDVAVVLTGVPLVLAPLLHFEEDVSFILVLRVGRLLRSFRLLRFVPDGERLWAGIRRGFKASLGAILALGLYNFMLALCACHLFGELSPKHFGDPITALYSMFKVFTVEGWFDVPDEIARHASPLMAGMARVFFVFCVASGGLLGLSMVNAVFVDEMVMDNTMHLEAQLARALDELRALREAHDAALASLDAKLERALQARPPPDV